MPRMTVQDKIWRANFWYRVWYGVIPGLPDDQVTLSKIGSVWDSAFEKESKFRLGDIYDIGGRLIGYNDIENMLSADTGLLHKKQFRIFREFKNPDYQFTQEEWENLRKEDLENWHENRRRQDQGLPQVEQTQFHIVRSQKIELRSIGGNSLNFLEGDFLRMSSSEVSISEAVESVASKSPARYSHHRFPNILELLNSTELPQPPSNAALPRRRIVTTRVYQKFIESCPSYMDSYKQELVEEA